MHDSPPPHSGRQPERHDQPQPGKPSITVGLWIELSDAALADGHGEGLIRWTRALISGFDAVPAVEAIVVPCQPGSERLMAALFAADAADGWPQQLISSKLKIITGSRSHGRAAALHHWLDRKQRRCRDRLAGLGASADPLSWLRALLPGRDKRRKPLRFALAMLGRLWKLLGAAGLLGFTALLRPFVRRLPTPFESLAREFSRRDGIGLWIVPNPVWTAAALLSGRLVVNVADIVYREFPLPDLAATDIERHTAGLHLLAAKADSVVCFSEHVAERQVRPVIGGVARRIVVVPHAPFRTQPCALASDASHRRLADDLRGHFRHPQPHRYFCDFPFERVEYLLVSSKCRPYKNYAGILQAYEEILRRHRRDLKLIVTGHISGNPDLAAVLHRRGLVFDVVEATNLPDDVHARLLQHARALVIPTFFEAALPFGFAEAVGLGTPVAMARIPVVEEALGRDAVAAPEYFAPHDIPAMTQAIVHVLDHTAAVLARQRGIVAGLQQRTWADVAADYLALGQGAGPAAHVGAG